MLQAAAPAAAAAAAACVTLGIWSALLATPELPAAPLTAGVEHLGVPLGRLLHGALWGEVGMAGREGSGRAAAGVWPQPHGRWGGLGARKRLGAACDLGGVIRPRQRVTHSPRSPRCWQPRRHHQRRGPVAERGSRAGLVRPRAREHHAPCCKRGPAAQLNLLCGYPLTTLATASMHTTAKSTRDILAVWGGGSGLGCSCKYAQSVYVSKYKCATNWTRCTDEGLAGGKSEAASNDPASCPVPPSRYVPVIPPHQAAVLRASSM